MDHGRPTFLYKAGAERGCENPPRPRGLRSEPERCSVLYVLYAYMYILFFLLVLYTYVHIRARELHSDMQVDFCRSGEHTHGVYMLAGSRFYTKEQALVL